MQTGFSQYYRLGQSVTVTPPAITGYATPAAQTVTLAADDNNVTIPLTYTAVPANNNGNDTASSTNTTNTGANGHADDKTLANTGTDLTVWVVSALVLVLAGAGVVGVVRRQG